MAINASEVKHVAKLAKLAFSEDDLQKFTGQMDKIIQMVQQLSDVETEGVPVTTHISDTQGVMRADQAEPGTSRDLLMRNVPQHQDGYIKVPAIIDESEEA
ncbi:Asp-tRNA(Asn)/Glu-tRNA(Gln) amidotransferase subunit GatC [Liquorilactobacillus satsumensis]|uniref:Asp-tRNA(Asn)/Glu-tRNA(Gln) amidotransferase subunit GatC n=1 Tax=Liquorilactobacillus satsumensis TaxID=259059 RepID=UPI0006D05AB6|nr:Asp-tRNA(Asn)/Glu-tRNA(Gln) amidotransferase subunit GatC [Liquorilactobacillus satsumensis]MCC7667600.1 Asp-tRNA(Asn)/Glu-tRNA(Gln) amidotransferase GatCAB subunit C [Liquorilactobacillus satsumensis]MCP9313198.1 Asp-tRNA(Asn)/Glu-tRNA(Gln) amidotransferase subunit GatC [Liquorilactobacillus satsumensis]MCP9329435.1 Asp-tRNA(Asn)/Glu-tRNA(Gln) amidotransferase subunit GatC [Liquorilactobacillus satsumensis]MCP9357926.1 Asp-tRNA(Asn)/Glu-tRNA(Gln) amidotransferase subunit GatC [Liquorilactob